MSTQAAIHTPESLWAKLIEKNRAEARKSGISLRRAVQCLIAGGFPVGFRVSLRSRASCELRSEAYSCALCGVQRGDRTPLCSSWERAVEAKALC